MLNLNTILRQNEQEKKLKDLQDSIKNAVESYLEPTCWSDTKVKNTNSILVGDLYRSDVIEICEKLLTLHDYDSEYIQDIFGEEKVVFGMKCALRSRNYNSVGDWWDVVVDTMINRLSDSVQKVLDDYVINKNIQDKESAYDNYTLSQSAYG